MGVVGTTNGTFNLAASEETVNTNTNKLSAW